MRPLKPLTISLPLAVLTALAIAGCGGGGGSDSTASTAASTETPSLTKAELISQGDAICAEVNAAVGSVGSSEAEVPQQITQVSGLYIGMVESIKGLGTPKEAAGYSEFIEAAEELSKVEGEAKLAAEREDTATLGEAATKATPILEEFESVAGEYGFEKCSEGPSAPTPAAGAAAPAEEEGGIEAAPEATEEAEVEEAAPEEVAPETGGAGGAGGVGEPAPEEEGGGSSGGVGPG